MINVPPKLIKAQCVIKNIMFATIHSFHSIAPCIVVFITFFYFCVFPLSKVFENEFDHRTLLGVSTELVLYSQINVLEGMSVVAKTPLPIWPASFIIIEASRLQRKKYTAISSNVCIFSLLGLEDSSSLDPIEHQYVILATTYAYKVQHQLSHLNL